LKKGAGMAPSILQMLFTLLGSSPIDPLVITDPVRRSPLPQELGYYFWSPVQIYPRAWEPLSAWLIRAVYRDRLCLVIEEHRQGKVGELATFAEVVAFLFMAAKTRRVSWKNEWIHIYGHASAEVITRHGRVHPGDTQLIASYQGEDLTLHEQQQFLELMLCTLHYHAAQQGKVYALEGQAHQVMTAQAVIPSFQALYRRGPGSLLPRIPSLEIEVSS
jgi:hypothetical protein